MTGGDDDSDVDDDEEEGGMDASARSRERLGQRLKAHAAQVGADCGPARCMHGLHGGTAVRRHAARSPASLQGVSVLLQGDRAPSSRIQLLVWGACSYGALDFFM